MTTVFGIKHPLVEAVVLVADRQTTSMSSQGTVAGKFLSRKLWASKDGNYCFGHSGYIGPETHDFIEKLVSGSIDIKKVIAEGKFAELRELNLERMGYELPDVQKMSGFILGTRFDNKPKLYTCFPLGSVQERSWTTMGSGDVKVNEYMQALGVLSEARNYLGPYNTNLDDVLRVGLEAVRRAQSQDIYSHGLDMLVCTPEGIRDHFAELGDDFSDKLKRIQDAYKK